MAVRAVLAAARSTVLLLLAVGLGCSSSQEGSAPAPVVLIGVDGLEWSVVLPLVRSGEMPAVRALMERGRFGKLATLEPTHSPAIWTTVATGKLPHKHGIHHFVAPRPGGGQRLLTSADRRTKALWNLFSDAGLRVHTAGWWLTFPVEAVRGSMVAQNNTRTPRDVRQGWRLWKGTVRPGV